MSASVRIGVWLLAPLLISLAFGSHVAAATCVPGGAYIRYVGDTASDAQCTDNDIQSAIDNTECPNTVIVITGEHTYTAQHLDINGKSLTLKATECSCGLCFEPPPPTSPLITISGAGHSGDSVLYIHGTSNVTLQYLSIEGGSNLTGYGGGIHFDGTGSLVLDTTTIRNNVAAYGGGINFTGSGGFAGLTLLGYTLVINNSAASSGGGIRIDGQSYMSALYDNTLIALNHAPDGYGGGINVVGPARADIGSPGLGTLGVVYSNDAQYGGGIAITGGSHLDDDAEVQLFTTDPLRAVHVSDNFASSSGGAFYLKGYVGFPALSAARLCAFDFRIDDNAAPEGSALHADYDSDPIVEMGSGIALNRDGGCTGLPPSARRCAAGVLCNTINGNHATDAAGGATLGATIRVGDDSSLSGDRFAMQRNEGGYAIRSSSFANAANCLLTNNQLTRQLLSTGSGDLEVLNCTLANNAILSTDTIHAEGPLILADSIIDQPGNLALAYSGGASDLHVRYVLSTDISTLPVVDGIMAGAPTYVDAANADYHLQLTSLGIDYAPWSASDGRDLDGLSRNQDLLEADNLWGVRDLGAYERQRTFACGVSDTIFCDGFDSP